MKVKPLADRVLIKAKEVEETRRGGIIIPDTAKEKPQEGTIISVGPGKLDENGKLIPMTLKQGDRIIFSKYAGTEITIDGEELLIMRESDILAIIEE